VTAASFSPLERRTLLALWDREDEFWQYLYLLSDRFIEDGDEDGARFVRWLTGVRQRPTTRYNDTGRWYWWTTSDDDLTLSWVKAGPTLHDPCLLPTLFIPICTGSEVGTGRPFTNFMTPSWVDRLDALEAALDHWRTLTDEQKVDLEENWRDG
jgi:hypothetical protein